MLLISFLIIGFGLFVIGFGFGFVSNGAKRYDFLSIHSSYSQSKLLKCMFKNLLFDDISIIDQYCLNNHI